MFFFPLDSHPCMISGPTWHMLLTHSRTHFLCRGIFLLCIAPLLRAIWKFKRLLLGSFLFFAPTVAYSPVSRLKIKRTSQASAVCEGAGCEGGTGRGGQSSQLFQKEPLPQSFTRHQHIHFVTHSFTTHPFFPSPRFVPPFPSRSPSGSK